MFKRRKPDEPHPPQPETGPAASSIPPPQDSGVGVPPFRPAVFPPSSPVAPPFAKEPASMARAPFATNPAPSVPPMPQTMPMAPRPAATMAPRVPVHEPSERRTLVVGRGISLQGVVQDAERLVVEGTVEATMIHAAELSIAPGGVFKGEVEVEDAEIAGTIDGTLTVRGNLVLRGTGRVLGTARYRRLQVEDGGQITGRMEMLTDSAAQAPTRETVAAEQ